VRDDKIATSKFWRPSFEQCGALCRLVGTIEFCVGAKTDRLGLLGSVSLVVEFTHKDLRI